MIQSKTNYPLFLAILLFIIGKILLLNTYFFWDGVEALSVPANYLYDHNFSNFNYPNFVSSPPLIHCLFALSWKIFGRTLLVSHIVMAIFSIGCITQIFYFCKTNIKHQNSLTFIFLLMVLDAAFLTQTLLLFPDTFLICFSFLSINLYQKNKPVLFSLALLALSFSSERASAACCSIGLAIFFNQIHGKKSFSEICRIFIKSIAPFMPSIIATVAFFIFKKQTTGAAFVNDNSPWKDSWHLVTSQQLFNNVKGVIRFMIDNGTIFIWIGFIFLWFTQKDKKTFFKENRFIFYLFICYLFIICSFTLPFTNQFGKKYFIMPCLFLNFLTGVLAFHVLKNRKTAIAISCAMIIGMVSSHFWVYPERFSRAWDCSLGHLPYYNLRKEALSFIDENNISRDSLSFFFPASQSGKYIELNNDERRFAKSEDAVKYIASSNISNNAFLLEKDLAIKKWTILKEFRRNGVYIKIYQRPQ